MIEQTPHERAMASLEKQCRELYRQMGRDAMLRQNDPVETLFTFAKRLIDDNSYVIGWNDGWDDREERLSKTPTARKAETPNTIKGGNDAQ